MSRFISRLIVTTLTLYYLGNTPAITNNGSDGPLGEWPDFVPIGFITAPHPDTPGVQSHLYGDYWAVVGEEFIFLQDGKIKLIYHSYHESYLTERTHEEEVLDNWALGYDSVTKVKFIPLVKTGGPDSCGAWAHTDTPGYIRHPVTGEHLLYYEVRPGTKDLHPEWVNILGRETAIQVATSDSPPAIGVPFNQTYENILVAEYSWELGWNNDGEIRGGLSEPTPVWVPHLGRVRLFYRGLHGSSTSYWNWRISYADSEDGKTGWVKNPVPTFDPSDPGNPAYKWTQPSPEGFSYRGAWQAHCTGDSIAGGVHMVCMVSPQGFAGYGHLAYYWSPDWGDTWYGHPDNPILEPGQFPDGVPTYGFQRTPTILVDDEYHRYILAYNATQNANTEPSKRRTYFAVAERPDPTAVKWIPPNNSAFQLMSAIPNPGGDTRLVFMLPEAGRLEVRIYTVSGQLLAKVVEGRYTAGRQSVAWDRTAGGLPFPSGVYFVRAVFEAREQRVDVTEGRIVVQH